MNPDLLEWITFLGYDVHAVTPLCGDASMRRYYRINHAPPLIVMDASYDPSVTKRTVEVGKRLHSRGVKTPAIIHANTPKGFLIIEDFGNCHLFDQVDSNQRLQLYQKAIDTLALIAQTPTSHLPLYDRSFVLDEMELMWQWYITRYLRIPATPLLRTLFDESIQAVAKVFFEQPQGVFVHRDFHSRNLLILKGGAIGVIDFQDARSGPLLYDAVSLLKDVYVRLEDDEIKQLLWRYYRAFERLVSFETFERWFDFTGMQRHIKILGIFSRLHLRDGKNSYLDSIPLTLDYLEKSAKRHNQQALVCLLERLKEYA